MGGLSRARSLVVTGAKSSQIRIMNRMGRYRSPQQMINAAREWVDMHESYLYHTSYWTYDEGFRKGRQLESRDQDAQLRGNVFVRLVRLQRSPRVRCVVVTAPDYVYATGDMNPYCYGDEIRVETWLEMRPDDSFYHAVMAVLTERYNVSF
ncbi:hypothetical protein IWQ60_010476 [Tieghemiomyces parasiticus]|uniref:Uncharacterized protein n=1 Tax=Tieghemiomyces parasiticus TaxID=78921 RepID=A0A9W7ZL12_9FUNG|nr:hypothetical protein IWQ60_010476 [Tieghemiomyces parasiticus]